MTAQMLRAAAVYQREPMLARALLEDSEACPRELRDFSWGYYHSHSTVGSPLPVEGKYVHIYSVAFAADGSILAAGHVPWSPQGPAPGVISLWDVKARKAGPVLRGHPGGITAVAFMADGKTLVSGCESGFVKLWDVVTGQEKR